MTIPPDSQSIPMTALSKLIKEVLELDAKGTPGPFIVERVDHEESITYEVSRDELNPSFHVIFAEYNSDAAKAKHNAHLYAHYRTACAKLALAAQRMEEELIIQVKTVDSMAAAFISKALADVQKIVEGE